MPLTGTERLEGAIKHYEHFKAVVEALGVRGLNSIATSCMRNTRRGVELLDEPDLLNRLKIIQDDFCLNSAVDLTFWDSSHKYVFSEFYAPAIRAGRWNQIGGWSLSHTVCTLKHAAVYNVLGIPKEYIFELARMNVWPAGSEVKRLPLPVEEIYAKALSAVDCPISPALEHTDNV